MTASLLPSLLAFFAVLAMIPAALWLMKRVQVLRPGAAGPLSIVAGLSMGPRERIAVIHAGGRYLVVGITSQQMTLLDTLDQWPGPEAPSATADGTTAGQPTSMPGASSPFSRLLRRMNPDDTTSAGH